MLQTKFFGTHPCAFVFRHRCVPVKGFSGSWRSQSGLLTAGVGFNQRSQRTRIRCGFVSGHVCINQYFRYNLVNSFNSKRMLKPEKLSRTKERVIFRKILLNKLAWMKYSDDTRG